jgi:hypothetical protein
MIELGEADNVGDSWTSCLGWQNTAEGRQIPGNNGGYLQKIF